MWWIALWPGCAATPDALYERGVEASSSGDVQAAVAAWSKACVDSGHIPSCVAAGALDEVGASERADFNERACEGGAPKGCLARSAEAGDRWVQRACELGDEQACVAAGIAADDPRDAARWLGQGCHEGAVSACLPAASRWAELGEPARAAALAELGCEDVPGSVACSLAPHWREVHEAAEACEQGARDWCVRACEQLRSPESCAAALEAAAAGCEGGDARACTVRAEAGVVTEESDDAVNEWLWRGCDIVDPLACLRLADRLERGAGAKPPKARGGVAWLRNQACDLQLDYACAPHAGW